MPQQIPLHLHQQTRRIIGLHAQITLSDMQRRLLIPPVPGITQWPQRRLGITATKAVDQHQQVHRQCQQSVRHRLEHMQQQNKQRDRRQDQNRQLPPGLYVATALKPGQLA